MHSTNRPNRHDWLVALLRGTLFWVMYGAIVLRGISPVTTLNAGIFLPLFLVHGILLQTFWCRIHLARRPASI